MHRSPLRVLSTFVIAIAACNAVGCGTYPQANVGDLSVYTTLHVREVSESNSDEMPGVIESLTRYYGPKKTFDENAYRVDSKLEAVQRSSDYVQASSVALSLDFKLAMKSVAAASTQPTTAPSVKDAAASGSGNASSASATGGGAVVNVIVENSSTTKPCTTPTSQPKEQGKEADAQPAQAAAGKQKDPAAGANGSDEAKGADASAGASSTKGGGDTTRPADPLAALQHDLIAFEEKAAASDSVFDELDRVTDFYAALTLKALRQTMDARAQSPRETASYIRSNEGPEALPDPVDKEASRELFLYFQVHVDPGTLPNQMAGMRVSICDTELDGTDACPINTWGGQRGADLVKVLRLHPTRNYDLENASLAESIDLSSKLSASIEEPEATQNADLSGSASERLEAEDRRRFISRIGKMASYAEAARHDFGWNFYPSNIVVIHTSAIATLGSLFVGSPHTYELKSYLDAGAHDCIAVILVPTNLRRFRCALTHYHARFDPNTATSGLQEQIGPVDYFDVPIPRYSPYEAVAMLRPIKTKTTDGDSGPSRGAPASDGKPVAPGDLSPALGAPRLLQIKPSLP